MWLIKLKLTFSGGEVGFFSFFVSLAKVGSGKEVSFDSLDKLSISSAESTSITGMLISGFYLNEDCVIRKRVLEVYLNLTSLEVVRSIEAIMNAKIAL